MKKSIFLLAVMVLLIIVISRGDAEAWFLGEARLEYSREELTEHAKEICLADLKCYINKRCFEAMGTSNGARFGNLRWHIQAKKAKLVAGELRYHLGNFGEIRHTGIMAWPFRVSCVSKVTTPNDEFLRQSDIKCFIKIDEFGDQLFAIPNRLMPFVKQD